MWLVDFLRHKNRFYIIRELLILLLFSCRRCCWWWRWLLFLVILRDTVMRRATRPCPSVDVPAQANTHYQGESDANRSKWKARRRGCGSRQSVCPFELPGGNDTRPMFHILYTFDSHGAWDLSAVPSVLRGFTGSTSCFEPLDAPSVVLRVENKKVNDLKDLHSCIFLCVFVIIIFSWLFSV